MIFEITAESIPEVIAASEHGAKRIELCSALDLGGLTPSPGLIEQTIACSKSETHVLIRPRPGDFVYTKAEYDIQKKDIEMAAQLGVHGVVIGGLTDQGAIDITNISPLSDMANSLGLEVTFHRALDFCTNLPDAIAQLIEMNFKRVLTSGQKPTALEGIEVLQKMVSWSGGQLEIMAGSGVNAKNAIELINSGVDALHFSIRKKGKDGQLGMGTNPDVDQEKLNSIAAVLKKL